MDAPWTSFHQQAVSNLPSPCSRSTQRGNSDNAMMQRIYGTAWFDKRKTIFKCVKKLERDYRKLGKTDLFMISQRSWSRFAILVAKRCDYPSWWALHCRQSWLQATNTSISTTASVGFIRLLLVTGIVPKTCSNHGHG